MEKRVPCEGAMTELTISICSTEDLVEVAALVNAAYRGEGGQAGWTSEIGMVHGQRITCKALKQDLASSADVSILTMRDAKELLACVRVELSNGARGQLNCHIGMLAVRPSAQDRGLGRTLLHHAETKGRVAGARNSRITVVSVRDSLIAWYERQGYRRTGETERFPYEDARFGTPMRPDLEFVVLEKTLAPQSGAQ
jgi:ribosomal protein S18 acetylase RimI-like enzyme